jgi:subtilisin-like proprotein convertase family protein
LKQHLALACLAVAFSASVASATTLTVVSLDVPRSIPDNTPAGITSTLFGPDLLNLTDLNLIFDDLRHTSLADRHIELTSPNGTTTVLVRASTENGILKGLGRPDNFVLKGRGTPDDFIETVFDDQAPTSLRDGSSPYTGSFNVNHPSVIVNPLGTFKGQNASGTWKLCVSDQATGDSGTLNHWSLQFTGTPGAAVPEPGSLLLLCTGLSGLLGCGWRRRR